MAYIKKITRVILKNIFNSYQSLRLQKIKGFETIYVIDIDNTLTISTLGSKITHTDPTPRTGMIRYVEHLISDGNKVIFLSARNFTLFKSTENWLRNQGIYSERQDLFLVESSISKIPYLKTLNSFNDRVVFIDDLSYNHENKKVKHYHKTLKAVQELNIDFKGLNFIEDKT